MGIVGQAVHRSSCTRVFGPFEARFRLLLPDFITIIRASNQALDRGMQV